MIDPKFQSSFIPKKPLVPTAAASRTEPINVAMYIGVGVFILVLVATAYVFFRNYMIKAEIEESKQILTEQEEQFDPRTIDVLTKLDKRLRSATSIINAHASIAKIFEQLSIYTLSTVRFTAFTMNFENANDIALQLKGEGEGFTSIALQSDVFGRQQFFKDPLISNFAVSQTGSVDFDFTAAVAASQILFNPETVTEVIEVDEEITEEAAIPAATSTTP